MAVRNNKARLLDCAAWIFYGCAAGIMLAATPSLAQQVAPAPSAAPSGSPQDAVPPTAPAVQPAATQDPATLGVRTAQSDAAPGSGDVIVTARRSSENLQKVPISITAFSQSQLTERAIASAYDLNKAVPGLVVTPGGGTPGNASFAIRGRGLNSGAASGSVETYFADVPLSSPFGEPSFPAPFFDLQSLQALKGPQGTLFGRNTTGGAVLLVPQAPTDRFEGYGRLQGGTYDDFQAEGAVNIPLSGDVADLRLAGFVWKRAGYQHTIGGIDQRTGQQLPNSTLYNHNEWNVRATLRLKPADWIENSTIFSYHRSINERYSYGPGLLLKWTGCPAGLTFVACKSVAGFNPATAVASAVPAPGAGTRTVPSDTVDYSHPDPDYSFSFINNTVIDINKNIRIKNILGYIYAQGYNSQGYDASGAGASSLDFFVTARPNKNKQITDELQLQGDGFDNRLTWIVGGLLDLTREPHGLTTMNFQSESVRTAFVPGVTVPYSTARQTFNAELLDTYAVFGSGTLTIVDGLRLTAGYRHTWNKIQDYVVISQPGSLGYILPQNFNPPLVKNDNGDTYNAGLDYQISTETLLYGAYRHGYKRGGFRTNAPTLALTNFGPEHVDSFSVGLKTRGHFGDVPFRFNIEGYYDLYKGEQVAYLTLVPAGIKGIEDNVPSTTYRGFDTDFTIDPAHWLSISGNYAFIDAFNGFYPDNTVAGVTQDLSSNPVPFAPKHKFSLTGRLHGELEDGKGEIAFLPTVNYQSVIYTSPYGTILPFAQQVPFGNFSQIGVGGVSIPKYATVDLRLEWNHLLNSKFDLAATVTNLTDKVYYQGNNYNITVGYLGYAYGPPRMFTVDLSFKF